MPNFETQEQLDQFIVGHGYVTSNDRALLIDPVRHPIASTFDSSGKPVLTEPTISLVPADQVQHYLDKGFRWPEAPAPPPPPQPKPKPIAGVTTTRRRRRRRA